MAEKTVPDEKASESSPAQSGRQIWLVCVLLILAPTLIVLLIKYLLDV